MDKHKISRHLNFATDVLFIDGSWGTGKSILGPVLGCFDRIEKQKLDHIFEYVATIHHLGEITNGAGRAMLGMYSDLDLFHSLVSREVNFRPADDTGILNNPKKFRSLYRLFRPADSKVVEAIQRDRPIPQIMSHHILPVSNILFEEFGSRLKIIEMLRHPLFMLEHWYNYIDRVGTDVREFNLWIKYKDQHLPWFADGWEEKFISLRGYDKVVHSISHITKMIDDFYNQLSKQEKKQILFISFENFVLDPYPYIEEIKQFLHSTPNSELRGVLKRQKCPRERLLDGRGHKSYGWSKVDKSFDEKKFLNDKKIKLQKEMSGESYDLLMSLSHNYEEKHGLRMHSLFN